MNKLNGIPSEESNFRETKGLYVCLYLIVSAIFIQQLYGSIVNRFFEMDLWWMIPSVFSYTEGKSLATIFKFIIGAEPYMLGAPPMKLFLFFVSSFLGPQPKNFIFILLIIHFLNSILLFSFSKRLKLGSRISFFSALTYLALYAHFESYIWAGNIQHILVTFCILLVLNLYLKTNELIGKGEGYYKYLILTLVVNLAATLSRISIFILPVAILAHILLGSRDDTERVRKYDIWIPLFISYLIYPLINLTSVGDDQIEIFLVFKSIPPILSWLIFLFLGILGLFLFRFCLQLYPRYKQHRFRKGFVLSICGMIYLLAIAKDIRNLLLPYNIMVPFAGTLHSFFRPLQSVFLLDSALWNHQIHSQMSPFGFFLGLVFLLVFWRKFVSGNSQLAILFSWYIIPFFYLNLYHKILSRYLVYISPVVVLVAVSVIICLYDYLTDNIKLKKIWREVFLAGLFIALLIPNIIAIKLALFRHKMATSFYLYDYIRAANIIKYDIMQHAGINKPFYVNGAQPMPFDEMWAFTPVDPNRYSNFRFALSQVLGGVPDDFIINKSDNIMDGTPIYTLSKDGGINNQAGENVDPFIRYFSQGLEEYKRGNYNSAETAFEKAVKQRPFLLNYVLSNYRVEDSRWLTNGKDLTSWLNRTINLWSGGTRKSRYIQSIIHHELSNYIQSLFFVSYLKYKLGDVESSKHWFFKIPYIETDYERVFLMLSQLPEISADKEAMGFLRQFTDPLYFVPSLWDLQWRERLPTEFQLFLVKFVLDGKINETVDTKVSKFKKKLRKERQKPHSMPQTL